jgi:hypothetical protein
MALSGATLMSGGCFLLSIIYSRSESRSSSRVNKSAASASVSVRSCAAIPKRAKDTKQTGAAEEARVLEHFQARMPVWAGGRNLIQ